MERLAARRERRETVSRETLSAARRGDEAAWVRVFDICYPQLCRFFHAHLPSTESAEDLASDVLLEAFQSIGRFRWEGKPFESWVFGIARHRLASYYRSRRPVAEPLVSAPRDDMAGVEIRDILARIPAHYREALELRFVVGLSGLEAAAAMMRSHGAFRSLLLRAREAFRREADWRDHPSHHPRRTRALPAESEDAQSGRLARQLRSSTLASPRTSA